MSTPESDQKTERVSVSDVAEQLSWLSFSLYGVLPVGNLTYEEIESSVNFDVDRFDETIIFFYTSLDEVFKNRSHAHIADIADELHRVVKALSPKTILFRP